MKVISTAPPEHLIKLMPTESEQYEYCRSISCYFECEHCVAYSESTPILTTMPIKKDIIQTKVKGSKFDNMAQNVINKSYEDHNHPLFSYILKKFTKEAR
jgi:hypothetical protein